MAERWFASRLASQTGEVEASRRLLSPRQAEMVDRLVDAAAAEARDNGYEGLTVRSAARRAKVAPATAYTYFASKDHLLAELLWRKVRALPDAAVDKHRPVHERVAVALRELALFMEDDPAVAAAGTAALLGNGPDVRALRTRVGAEMHRRIVAALGDCADPGVVRVIDLAFFGAMLEAGLGHLSFDEVAEVLSDVARVVLSNQSVDSLEGPHNV